MLNIWDSLVCKFVTNAFKSGPIWSHWLSLLFWFNVLLTITNFKLGSIIAFHVVARLEAGVRCSGVWRLDGAGQILRLDAAVVVWRVLVDVHVLAVAVGQAADQRMRVEVCHRRWRPERAFTWVELVLDVVPPGKVWAEPVLTRCGRLEVANCKLLVPGLTVIWFLA